MYCRSFVITVVNECIVVYVYGVLKIFLNILNLKVNTCTYITYIGIMDNSELIVLTYNKLISSDYTYLRSNKIRTYWNCCKFLVVCLADNRFSSIPG